jgi:hypothetical protein
MDVFVAKFSPSGTLLWSTFIGGPNYDRAYAIELDPAGNVIVSGRAGRGFPVTAGAFQTTFQGYNTGPLYGEENAFIFKLTPNGSSLVFSTYEGPFEMNRDIAVDANGDIYAASNYDPTNGGGALNTAWFANAFQNTPQGSKDGVIIKVKGDGTQVLWATFLGGSAPDSGTPSIRVDSSGSPYVLLGTNSSDMPTTTGAYDRTYSGSGDLYLAKLSPNGSSLIYATYFGGSAVEYSETHGLALDSLGNAYIAGTTESTNLPTTTGAYDLTYNGASGPGSGTNYTGDAFIAKISANGTSLLACTYLGGSAGEGLEGISIDAAGNVYLAGATYSTNFPITSGSYRTSNSGDADLFVAKLSGSLTQLLYSSYIGGAGTDYGRSAYALGNGFYVVGMSSSTNFPVLNASQGTLRGGYDGIVMKFSQ